MTRTIIIDAIAEIEMITGEIVVMTTTTTADTAVAIGIAIATGKSPDASAAEIDGGIGGTMIASTSGTRARTGDSGAS